MASCAFLNVCPHRHCRLTAQPCGSAPTLRCQYHGWEYNKEGRTGKIPDAGCFRPWDRDHARLKQLHLDSCGDLLFLSFADDPPPLRDHLGHYFEPMAQSFAPPFRYAWKFDEPFPSNWKVAVENTVEGYHVPSLHPGTLEMYPPEETITHLLNEKWSTLHTREYNKLVTHIQNWLVRRTGVEPTNRYTHHLIYPNTAFVRMDIFAMCMNYLPTGPTTSVQRAWLYTLRGPGRGPLARGSAWILRLLTTWIVKRILVEDVAIFGEVQKGLEASCHRGVLGTLEERIYPFQSFILHTCAGAEAKTSPHGTEAASSAGEPVNGACSE